VRTVESLYQALSRQDFSAARALFSGDAANQFDPAFFRQFTRVEVADLQPSSRSAGSVTLDGVVSFFYPDGSLQKEARTFTLDTNSDTPRVVASAFGMVVRPRSPNP
jgi:serine/threonine-protein kinase